MEDLASASSQHDEAYACKHLRSTLPILHHSLIRRPAPIIGFLRSFERLSTTHRTMATKSGGEAGSVEENEGGQLSRRQRLKLAVRDYGATVMVFHVSLALTSLAFFYLAISSDLDMVSLVKKLPWLGPKMSESSLGVEASTFVVAYAVHKVFAPVRISITLTITPVIVRALRSRGFLKP